MLRHAPRHLRRTSPTRLATVAAGAALALTACGDDAADTAGTASEPSATVAGPTVTAAVTTPDTVTATTPPVTTLDTVPAGWSFTDDVGTTVELAQRPERIVMFEDVAASLMDFGVRPVGIHYLQGQGNNQVLEGLDVTGIADVGANCGEVNIEALAETDPDLIVYMNWGEPAGEAFCLDAAQFGLLSDRAPIVQITAMGAADEILSRYAELAEALGADLESAELVAKRQRYDDAADRLAAAVSARPEITVIPVSISPDWAGVAEPGGFADLVTLQDRFGIDFEGPFSGEFTETWWQEYSAETISQQRGDVILMDAKNATALADKQAAFPLWAALPEVEAGQIVDWFVPGSFSYTRDAQAMEALAEAIENAHDLVT